MILLRYGARVTGGGSGGTVVVMGRNSHAAKESIRKIQEEYFQQTSIFPQLFEGSSIGAAMFGAVVVRK